MKDNPKERNNTALHKHATIKIKKNIILPREENIKDQKR